MSREGVRADATAVRLERVGPGAHAVEGIPVSPRRRALVVDDERALLMVICRMVETMGWASDGCDESAAAIAMFTRNPSAYDIVLTDMRLGEASGLDVAAAAVRARPGIPIILLSGAPLPATKWEAAADAGVQMVLYKPFHVHELVGAIRGLTERGPTFVAVPSRLPMLAPARPD